MLILRGGRSIYKFTRMVAILIRFYSHLYLRLVFAILIAQVVLLSQSQAETLLQLSLPAAVDRALSSNRSLMVSRMSLESDKYSIDAAYAEFAPKIGPAVTLGRVGNSALFPGGGGANNSYGILLSKKYELGTTLHGRPSYNQAGDTSNTTLNLGVTQPLLKGLGAEINLDGVRRAEFLVASTQMRLEQARIDAVLETISTFYEANKQGLIVEMNDALCKKLRQHVAISRSKEKIGLAGSMDTYRAEIKLKDAEDALSRAKNAYFSSIGRLKLLVNVGQDVSIDLLPPDPPSVNIADPELDAEKNSLELAQARSALEEAERSIRVADNARLPDVNLQLNYGLANRTADPFAQALPTTNQTWSVSLQSSTNLLRTAEKSNYYRAKMSAEMLRVNLQQKKDDIKHQVRQQVLYIAAAKERSIFRIEQIKQAEGKLALAEMKFTHGMADNFSIIETETELQNARIGLLTDKAEHAMSVYGLAAITGHLFDGLPQPRPTN